MDIESYPPSHLSYLVQRVRETESSTITRDWTGNDESARNHNGIVYLSESPLRLRLSWKKSPHDPSQLIGVFDLDLRRLLDEQYIRADPRAEDSVRLRFYHGLDNVIYIQANTKKPAIPVGIC